MPSLIKEIQLATVFSDEYADCEHLPPHNFLSKEFHILHNMLTQIIIPRTRQESEMFYIDLFIKSYLLREEKINLPFIIMKKLTYCLSS